MKNVRVFYLKEVKFSIYLKRRVFVMNVLLLCSTGIKCWKSKVLFFRNVGRKNGLKYVKFLHDNASMHRAAIVTKFVENEKVTTWRHPPYFPDLVPSDCFQFHRPITPPPRPPRGLPSPPHPLHPPAK